LWMLTLCLRLIRHAYSLLRLGYHHAMELFFTLDRNQYGFYRVYFIMKMASLYDD